MIFPESVNYLIQYTYLSHCTEDGGTDMDIHSILKYFLDYETEIKFQQSSLQNVEGYDYSIEAFEDAGRIEWDILQRKSSHLLQKISSKKKQITRRSGYEDNQVFMQTIHQSPL